MPELPDRPADEPSDGTADVRARERREGDRARLSRVSRQSALALLAGVVAVATVLALGWRQVTLERELERKRESVLVGARDLDALRAQLATVEGRAAEHAAALARLGGVPAGLEAARADLDTLRGRLAVPDRAFARVEAAQLVELAIRRLGMERDVAGATALFEAADERLASTGDPALFRARSQLARDLAQLRAAPAVDVRGLVARLARAADAARELPMLGAIRPRFGAEEAATPEPGGFARAWARFTTSLQDLVSIRRVSEASVQLVSMEEAGVRRQHLETLLYGARLAAWRGDAPVYDASLREARDWLDRYYDARDPRVAELARELEGLAAVRLDAPLPDVSATLRALRAGAP